jgi:spore maturation protein CgeB
VEKCRYYLAHDDARRAIATAGRERALREHTWEHRFKTAFTTAGLA